jgi:hypothetical protein
MDTSIWALHFENDKSRRYCQQRWCWLTGLVQFLFMAVYCNTNKLSYIIDISYVDALNLRSMVKVIVTYNRLRSFFSETLPKRFTSNLVYLSTFNMSCHITRADNLTIIFYKVMPHSMLGFLCSCLSFCRVEFLKKTIEDIHFKIEYCCSSDSSCYQKASVFSTEWICLP